MKTNHALCGLFSGLLLLAAGTAQIHAGVMTTDNFGSGGNAFSVQFAAVGNAGNANDAGAGGGIYSSPYGGVSYNYRMGVTEVPQDWFDKAANLGLANVTAGGWIGNQPAANMTWYQAAAFVNWMNTSTGHQAAYRINAGVTALTLWSSAQAWQAGGENLYRHKDAFYFLPSEGEWYKAAYHKNDGVTANYWDYATGSNSIPDGIDFNGDTVFDAVFNQGFSQAQPGIVTNVGVANAYGVEGQNGNVWDLLESANDGVNNTGSENRVIRGGGRADPESLLRSSARSFVGPGGPFLNVGFRVASIEAVPEPGTALFGIACVGVAAFRRRRSA